VPQEEIAAPQTVLLWETAGSQMLPILETAASQVLPSAFTSLFDEYEGISSSKKNHVSA
jgi:hypothetical protein